MSPLSLALPTHAAAAAAELPFATVSVHRDPAAVASAWSELTALAPCTVYQTPGFIGPWMATLGRRAGLRPFFVLARDGEGRAAALLPLGIASRGGVRVASWLGGRDSNLPMALLRRPQGWSAADLRRLLHAAAAASPAAGQGAPHLFHLPNQPAVLAGVANPFAGLPHAASPSAAHGTVLPADPEALFAAKLSKDARKKLRKKEARLAGMGRVRHLVAGTEAERAAIIDAVLAHKSLRLRARGIASDFEAPEMRRFITEAARGGAIELHALLLDDRIVAAYGGGAHAGRWSGMFNAFDPDEEIARSSPGELLLLRIVAHCCARGIGRFDLGIGEARYKAALCDEAIPLIDVAVATSLRGRGFAAMLELRQVLKRRIKRAPRLHALLVRLPRLGR